MGFESFSYQGWLASKTSQRVRKTIVSVLTTCKSIILFVEVVKEPCYGAVEDVLESPDDPLESFFPM